MGYSTNNFFEQFFLILSIFTLATRKLCNLEKKMVYPTSYSRHTKNFVSCVLDMREINKNTHTSGVRKMLGHTLQRGNAFYLFSRRK